MTRGYEMSGMASLFEQYRELSRMLIEEAQAIRADSDAGPRDLDESNQLERRAAELNRLMADYYRRDRLC